jgi:hypothetical protein
MTEMTVGLVFVSSICGLFLVYRLTDGLYKGKLQITIAKILEVKGGDKIPN